MRTTKQEIRDNLKNEQSYFIEATSMINGGTIEYWLVDGDEEEPRGYGRGPNWHDQTDEITLNFEELVDLLYIKRRFIKSIEGTSKFS